MRVEFTQEGLWNARNAAVAWCREHGIAVGQSSAGFPSGLLFGDYAWIAKWKNLTKREVGELHGSMSGNFRDGPVVVTLKDEAVAKHAPELAKTSC